MKRFFCAKPALFLRRTSFLAVPLIAFFFCSPVANAQFAVPAVPMEDPAKRLQEEERTRERERRLVQETPGIEEKKPSTIQEDDGRSPGELPDVEPMFKIDEIDITGNTILTNREIEKIVAPFRGVPLGVNRANLLIRRLTVAYIEKGYITTRAYLQEQNLKGGKLRIDIVEGSLEGIRYNGSELPFGVQLAFPTREGEKLYLPDLEQGVDQLNRLRRNQAKVMLVPGEKPGGTFVEVENRPQSSTYFNLGIDDAGSPSSGRTRLRGSVETESLLGFQEYMTVNYTGSSNTNAALFSANAPHGYDLFSYTFSYSDYLSPLGNFALYSGNTYWHNIAWNRVLQRNAQGKTALDVSFSQRTMRRYINDVELTPQRLSSIRVAVNTFKRLSWGQWMAEGAYSQGIGIFNANSDPSGLPDEAAHSHFKKISGLFSLGIPLVNDWLYRSSISWQYSKTGLYSSEQLYLGGDTTVRGFIESPVAGDRGFVWRNDASFGLRSAPLGLPAMFEPYIFLDYGRAMQLALNEWQQLAGTGFGARLYSKSIRAEASVGWPVEKPASYSRGVQLMANLNYLF
ncbi:MAG: ShlB/FhaC/HecB family hemolysin secretion/activation protein [Burkholderiales bacterium]|nr:ShlB/FhaC/HecB family hemolysin secretion/activation protein [Burkholderiales bacterium]